MTIKAYRNDVWTG